MNRFQFFEHNAFNSRVKDIEDGSDVFPIHFAGTSEDKYKHYKKLQSILKKDASLIDPQYLNGIKFIDTSVLSYRIYVLYRKIKSHFA